MAKHKSSTQSHKISVKKGDNVVVISGKDAGKTGEVKKVLPKDNKVIVEGVNLVTHHTKPKMQYTKGSKTQKEAPLYANKVMLYDPAVKKGVRIGHKLLENDQKVRISRKTGEQIGEV